MASPTVASTSSGEGSSSSFRPAPSSSVLNPKQKRPVTASRGLCCLIQADAGSPVSRVVALRVFLGTFRLVSLFCHAERFRSTPESCLLRANGRGHLYRLGVCLCPRATLHGSRPFSSNRSTLFCTPGVGTVSSSTHLSGAPCAIRSSAHPELSSMIPSFSMAHAHHAQRRSRYATKLRMATCRHRGHGGDSANGVPPRTYLCKGARETGPRDQTFENPTGISRMSTATRIVCMPDGSNLMRWKYSNHGLRENQSSNGGSGYNGCRLPAIKAPERERQNRSILHNQGGKLSRQARGSLQHKEEDVLLLGRKRHLTQRPDSQRRTVPKEASVAPPPACEASPEPMTERTGA